MTPLPPLPPMLVATQIFSRVAFEQRGTLPLVCKLFRDAAYHDAFWIDPLKERGLVLLPNNARSTFVAHIRRVIALIVQIQEANIVVRKEDKANLFQVYQSTTDQLENKKLLVPSLQLGSPVLDPLSAEQDFALRTYIELGGPINEHIVSLKAKCSEELLRILIYKKKLIVGFYDLPAAIDSDYSDSAIYLIASSLLYGQNPFDSLFSQSRRYPEQMIRQLADVFPVSLEVVNLVIRWRYSEDLIRILFNKYLETFPDAEKTSSLFNTFYECKENCYSDDLILEFLSHATSVSLEYILDRGSRRDAQAAIPSEQVARAIVEKKPNTALKSLEPAIRCRYSEEFLRFLLQCAAEDSSLDTSRCIYDLFSYKDSRDKPYSEQLIAPFVAHASSVSDCSLSKAISRNFSSHTVKELAVRVSEVRKDTLWTAICPSAERIPLDDETLTTIIASCQDVDNLRLEIAYGHVSDAVLKQLLGKPVSIDYKTIHEAVGKVSDEMLRLILMRGVEMFGKRNLYRFHFLYLILSKKLSESIVLDVIKMYDETDAAHIECAKKHGYSNKVLSALHTKLPSMGCIIV